jgi:peptidoglycan DL-endopeptidase CwlO
VIVITGAMVASLALPASAATTSSVASSPVAVAAPSAAHAPLLPQTFGSIGFTGVVKPPPVVVHVAPVARPAAVVSRSITRAPIATRASAQNAPAPAPAAAPAPRSGGVLGIASSLAGIYYIYGGTTTAGFDCSGFTQYVFKKAGISLPRTTSEQQNAVTTVSSPQPGDLVFFGSPAYHVGIYAGNGKMWDSPRTGKAVALRDIWSTTVTYGRP